AWTHRRCRWPWQSAGSRWSEYTGPGPVYSQLGLSAHIRPAPAEGRVGQRLQRRVQLVHLLGDPVQALEAVQPAADHLELVAEQVDPLEQDVQAAVALVHHQAVARSPSTSSTRSFGVARVVTGGAIPGCAP